jgi:hypothetical protein
VGFSENSEHSFLHPRVPRYFTGKHFSNVGNHGPVAWDDCISLLLLQESGEGTAPTPSTGATAFVQLEKEFRLMKPFLMYSAVFAAKLARMNLHYTRALWSELFSDLGRRSGLYEDVVEGDKKRRKIDV